MIVPRSFSHCGGATDSIISVFRHLHKSSLNLKFETMPSQYDRWLLIYEREKEKLMVASKTALQWLSSHVKPKLFFKERVLASY